MRRALLLTLFLGVGLILFGCSENNPNAPEMSQSDQVLTPLAKRAETPFGGTSVTFEVVDLGRSHTLPNGRIQTRGLVVRTQDDMNDDRVTGVVTWVVNMDEYPNGEDKRWGTGELIIPGRGKWQMPYKGWVEKNTDDGRFYITYEVEGHGKGDFKGLKAHWTYFKEKVPGPFAVTGFIVERN